MKRIGLVVGFVALAGLIGFVVRLPGGGGNSNAPAVGTGVARGMASGAPAEKSAAGGAVFGSTTTSMSGGGSTGSGGSGTSAVHGTTTSGGGGGGVPMPAPRAVSAAGPRAITAAELVGPRVIETAQLSLVAKRDGFDQAFSRAMDVASRYRGYVESSSTEGVRSKFGRLTIRVPANEFQPAIHDLRSVGRVEGQSISGQDVTSQYVDLQARLRNWEAQERVLLRLMSRATTIGDTLRIQNELSQVQMRIEELKGQLRVLNDQTSLATIEVSVRESGSPVNHPRPVHHTTATLLQAWRDARHGFVGVIASIVVGLGYLVPITALLALVWLGLRRLRPRVAT